MTTLRPERPADGPMSYEDTGQFRAVVESLDDPLNDPLPGRPPAPATPSPQPEPEPQSPTQSPTQSPAQYPSQPPSQPQQPSAPEPVPAPQPDPGHGSPWFRAPEARADAFTRTAAPDRSAAYEEPAVERPGFGQEGFGQADFEPPPFDEPAFDHPGYEKPAFERPGFGQAESGRPGFPVPAPVPADAPAADDMSRTVQETVQLPVVIEPEGPVVGPVVGLGPDGGRAARRKAARQGSGGGGHRARGRVGAAAAAPGGPGGPGAPAETAAAPLSRVEARKAQRAAKDSPAVVASRVVGELFITLGVLMLLFVVYQLWWTNVRAHAEANGAANSLQKQWNSTSDEPDPAAGSFHPGQGFAIMYIPKLDVKAPIAQGVSKTKVLDKGEIGHYDGALNTAMPWDKAGNFAVAAHRNTHGEPFRYINRLVPGDKVVVETANAYYTYVITSSLPSTSPGNTSVLRPIPAGSGFTKPGRYLTLTTCTPEFTSKYRLIVWGKLIDERPRSKGKPAALTEG